MTLTLLGPARRLGGSLNGNRAKGGKKPGIIFPLQLPRTASGLSRSETTEILILRHKNAKY